MLQVDISNLWTCVSLPDLLGSEEQIFHAHNSLAAHTPEGPGFMSWLQMPASAVGRLVFGISQAARTICDSSQVLLVCGSGGGYHGIRAAIEAMGQKPDTPEILYVGATLDSDGWICLSRYLEHKDYSVLLYSPDGCDIAVNVAARSLRWMLEQKYAGDANHHIYVATLVGTLLHTMAQEAGYTLFPLPKELGGTATTLTAAAMMPMAVAGLEPAAILEGALAACEAMDIRSFDNPAWLYGAARWVLQQKGRSREFLCLTRENLLPLGQWAQRTAWLQGVASSVEPVLLPGDLDTMDTLAMTGNVFETVLRFEEPSRALPVEMDWKDYDGLGFLAGKTVEFVEESLLSAVIQNHNQAGVPLIEIAPGRQTEANLGALLYFFELSTALTAAMSGQSAFAANHSSRDAALSQMAKV